MWGCCVCSVHALGTTGLHNTQRRAHVYAHQCAQCDKELAGDYVAAHVVSYPCCALNCCVGYMRLVTTCRACNSANQLGKKHVNRQSAFFETCEDTSPSDRLGCVVWPCMLHYTADARNVSSAGTGIPQSS